METEGEKTREGVWVFGIRHLSAGGAWHLRRFLDAVKPDVVFIEGPSDANPLINDIADSRVKPPIALLCYTSITPIQSLLYPFARYSPEYQAVLWAKKHKKRAFFMDLSSGVKIHFSRLEEEVAVKENQTLAENGRGQYSEKKQFYDYAGKLYKKTAELSGEPDYDSYWERNFEHNLETGAYTRAVAAEYSILREMTEPLEKESDPLASSINVLREAFMKRRIMEVIAEGVPPEKIVAVMGAYHVSGVMRNTAMTDAEFAGLPADKTDITLMPYTYYRLSTFSGYGAGNYAPGYFEMMFDAMSAGELNALPSRYITEVSRVYRDKQGYSSTASAIEAARLAQALQYLHGGIMPTLRDLHDAAIATIGAGQDVGIAEAFAKVDVGTATGFLPAGLKKTPIQDDFYRQLKELRLDGSHGSVNYKTPEWKTLELDLRENRGAKTREAAFRDLNRSVFLNRLVFLNIGFAELVRGGHTLTTFETWNLRWNEEIEIQIVESLISGNTIEAAASYKVKEKLEESENIATIAELIRVICVCGLSGSFLNGLKKLQDAGSVTEDFTGAALAASAMNDLAQYGNVRKFDTEPILPILKQLFFKASLLLYNAASCDDKTAREVAEGMNALRRINAERKGGVNEEAWQAQLEILAKARDRNPLLCGYACSILLERGEMDESELIVEISRYLSAGNTPESGASWFEGLASRNHQLLLLKNELWNQLDVYINTLDAEEFKRALVCLRRAFDGFDNKEKAAICEKLAKLWNVDAGNAAEAFLDKLSEGEENAVKAVKESAGDLNNFDFSDIL
jgi:hypothetical protein